MAGSKSDSANSDASLSFEFSNFEKNIILKYLKKKNFKDQWNQQWTHSNVESVQQCVQIRGPRWKQGKFFFGFLV